MKNKVFKLALTIFLAIGILFSLASSQDRYFEISKNLEIFTSLFKELNEYYVDEIDPNELMRVGIDAMLESLDPYTNFIAKADLDEYQLQTTGIYGGIGARIGNIGDFVTVTEPYEGFPAFKAGLRAGDEIHEIDGRSAKGLTSTQVSQVLRGQPGTDVKVKIYRAGSNETFETVITRGEVTLKNVPYYGVLKDGVGYIKLVNFAEKAGKEVEDALRKLKENPELKGVILDLRGNGGGLLHEAINVTNVFIERGVEVVSTKGKVRETNKKYMTLNKPVDTEIPLVILTDEGSASASEIVSGALQDLDRGVVIGQQTFGKGLVQITRPVAYNSRLKVTTSKYYIPSGRCIQAIDYSIKESGENGRYIPDSLRRVYKTQGGREVKDGAGIDPDISVEIPYMAHITQSLHLKNHIFNFSTNYFYQNKELRDGSQFTMNDEEFNSFISFLEGKDYDYVTNTEKIFEELKETAKDEDYYEAIESSLKDLEKNIQHDKDQDVYKHKDEIIRSLEVEIVSRYLFQNGRIESSLKQDLDIEQAIKVLGNKDKYNTILTKK